MGLKQAWKNQDERSKRMKAKAQERNLMRKVHKIEGKPWWESDRTQLLLEYDDMGRVDQELSIATAFGWYIADTDGDSGHINVGRTTSAAVLTAGVSLLFGASRSKGKTKINWRRDDETPIVAIDDAASLLRQLGSLRDEGILTDEEFEAKKAEILARM
jgi:hypothetical protein